ncbi:hypothetical protein [Novosphingobium sp.]|uniref:hypothetical protein n=1 Tax=Novosphingobium sp. TaxID=1874826 RepID=UPI0035AFD9DB
MKGLTEFSMLSLLPAALNLAVPASGATLVMPFCTGDGLVRSVEVPVGGQKVPGNDSSGTCCAKGCHSGSSRKRHLKEFEPSQ